MRYIGYVRASTSDQVLTLDVQESQLRAWAVAFSHEIDVRVEGGVSGGVAPSEREVLGNALRQLDLGEYDGLVFVKIDRVSRSTKDVIELIERAEGHGWALVSKNESLDTSSATGRFFVRMLASLAELERDLVGERTKVALAQLKKSGKPYSRFSPWGYFARDGALVEDRGELAIMEFVTSTCGMMAMSLPAAARKIQETFGNHPRTGRPWTETNVRNVLRAIERAGE